MTVYRTIGLMSGTSLDGVDAALCRISIPDDEPLTEAQIDVKADHTDEYDPAFRSFLERCCSTAATPEMIARANVAIATQFAETVDGLLTTSSLSPEEVDLIGSHGQTIWHAPELEAVPGTDRRLRTTLQVGDGAVIARETGIDTVTDVRMGDIAAGGHGAPLSPLLDWIQFGSIDESRIVQNIGGIGNCTVLEQGVDRESVTAFDTGPGNMVIDALVATLTDGDQRYDEDGQIAASGTVDYGLLEELLDDPYFDASPPKSTGREYFGIDYTARVLECARERGLDDRDVVATATALTSESIADAYDRHATVDPDRVVLSGGGAWNETLVAMLEDALSCPVETSHEYGIDPDSREAVLFAVLAALFDADRTGNMPSVTGATAPAVLGKLSRGH